MRQLGRPWTTQLLTRKALVLGIIILLALALRLIRLGFQPLWWDEGWSLYFASTDLLAMLRLTAVDIHPPLYYALLHLWTQVFGTGVLSVRLMSVIIGVISVPLLYVTGRRLLGIAGGLLAALLLAISPFHIYYAQEVRMYGLVTLLCLAALYFALRIGGSDRRAGVWLGYVMAATAALYTQYLAAFLLVALNVVMLVVWVKERRPFRASVPWLGAQLAVAALFMPWVWYAGDKLLTYVRFKVDVEQDVAMGLGTYLARHLAAFNWGHAEGILADWWWLGLLPLVLLLVCLVVVLWRRRRAGAAGKWGVGSGVWPWIVLIVTLGCGYAVNFAFPFNPLRGERQLLLALPAYLLLFASGLLTLRRWRRSLALLPAVAFVVLAGVSLAFYYTAPRYADDDYRPVAAQVRAHGLPTDAIVNVHPWQVGYFQGYMPDDDARPTLVLTPREVLPRERQLWIDDPALMADELDALLDEHGRLWLPAHQAMGRGLERQIEAHLIDSAYPVLSEWHGENTVQTLYAEGETTDQPVTADFGGWLSLEGAALDPGPHEAGWGIVPIDLTWQPSVRPRERYHVGLRLVDAAGRVFAQRDSLPGGGQDNFFDWPLEDPTLDRHGLLVPAGTPPGEYEVTLRIYRSHDVAVVPVTFEGGSGGEVTLGSVTVIRPETPPPVDALAIDQPLYADFGDRLRFLGYSTLGEDALLPGEAVAVDLFWEALADPGEDFYPRLQLQGAGGEILAELTEKPVAGTYPTAWWKAGERVRDAHDLPVGATVPEGVHRLLLSLVRAADGGAEGGVVETSKGQTALDLGEIKVLGRERRFEPTAPQHPQTAQFGPAVELMGYDKREVVRKPGSPLEVTLHWHALDTPDRNYHTFVHLLDAGGEIVAQHDGVPGDGELPALGWLPGEYLVDSHLLQLPFYLPDGVYHLRAGLYDPVTGHRPAEPVLLESPVPVEAVRGCNCR